MCFFARDARYSEIRKNPKRMDMRSDESVKQKFEEEKKIVSYPAYKYSR